ncbi:hypothetical protein [Halorubrum halophilum]|nr:hypothetical protein [Halorubrum halophilum]
MTDVPRRRALLVAASAPSSRVALYADAVPTATAFVRERLE